MPSANNRISIIIPSARPEKVARTVRGLLDQTALAVVLEILIVTPYPHESAIHRDDLSLVRVVPVDTLQPPGKMRNIGARNAAGDYLAFIDDDCVPAENWLVILLSGMTSLPLVAMTGCRVVSGEPGFWGKGADLCLFMAYQYTTKHHDIDLGSAAVMVRRDVFEAVGGFDESLLASEDWDFSLRLRQAGWQCVFTPDTEVVHYHGRDTFTKIVRNAYRSGHLSGLVVQRRHYHNLSWLAKLSVIMGKPLLYGFLVVPYAAAVTLFQGRQVVCSGWKGWLYLPLVFLCRLLYHCGVLRRLIQDCTRYPF